mgnify:CR=1 FL=1
MKNFCFCLLLLVISCQKDFKKSPHSFYYWRTHLELNPEEKKALNQSEGKNIYVRFFDIDKVEGKFQPMGIITKDKSFATSKKIVPVIFISWEKSIAGKSSNSKSLGVILFTFNKHFIQCRLLERCVGKLFL